MHIHNYLLTYTCQHIHINRSVNSTWAKKYLKINLRVLTPTVIESSAVEVIQIYICVYLYLSVYKSSMYMYIHLC